MYMFQYIDNVRLSEFVRFAVAEGAMGDFTWCRSVGGYEWETRENRQVLVQRHLGLEPGVLAGDKLKLVLGTPTNPRGPFDYRWETYQTSKRHPPLFRQFAELVNTDDEIDPDRVLAFTSEHGHLTLHCRLSTSPHPDVLPQIGARKAKMIEMAAVANERHYDLAWRLLCGLPDRAEQYRPVLDCRGDPAVWNQGIVLGETFELWRRNARVLRKLVTLYDGLSRSADVVHDRATLEAYIGEELDGRAQFAVTWQGGRGELAATGHLDLRPRDLLGFIWLQFAREVAGAERYRRCPQCKEYFSLERYGLTANQGSFKRTRAPYSNAEFCTEYCYKQHFYLTVTKPARASARVKQKAQKKKTSPPVRRPRAAGG